MAYAERTSVPVAQSVAEIQRTVQKYGGEQFLYAVAEDNLLAALKHYLDGIARGLRVNDRTFRCKGIEWLPKAGEGKVVITF